MMGSMGYGNIKKILEQIDTYPKDFQVLCVCGTNKKIKSVVMNVIGIKKYIHTDL